MEITQDMKNQLEKWMGNLFHYQYGEIKPGTMSNWETGMIHGVTDIVHIMGIVNDTKDMKAEIMRAIGIIEAEACRSETIKAVTQNKAKAAALKTILAYIECVEMVGSLEGPQP